ncbi:hemerythrin domain-containing protein [Segetibacter koreensis]|uniref:hemerythrin domain-containing protein n=1 Tax=Segetibacter koreensis TaxID=398037 RepID=UPI0003745926|nr:hemerythrin domain-containing protein [Segetibacter koreensis]
MKLNIPDSIKEEHNELHKTLEAATHLPGKTGEAAKKVARLLHPHFVKEEQYALPPLALLLPLSEGNISSEMRGVIDESNKLKQELPKMLAEHKQIIAALEELIKAATEELYPEVIDFAERLQQHAKTEEEVFYPTSILIGEYLKLKLQEEVNEEEYYP